MRGIVLPGTVRIAAATIAIAGLSLLATACGGSPGGEVAQLGSTTTTTQSRSSTTTSARSTPQAAALAFSRCMRSHGVPSFPDPTPQGDFPSFHAGVPKHISVAANETCKHLLSSGTAATPQQRQQKLAFGVKVAQCLRAHGYPNFPDPTRLGSQSLPAGIDPNAPQFQSAQTTCEKLARKALGIP